MKNYLNYYKQQTFDKMVKAKEETEKQLELLKSIKRVYKKDGTEFQNLLKNFSSELGNFRFSYGDNLYFENYPTSVYLNTYYNLQYDKDMKDKYEKEAPERIVKEYGLVDRVFFNADELREEIQKKISFYENYLKEQNENIKNFEKVYLKIEKAYGKLVEIINETSDTAQYKRQEMLKQCL